jgi:peroxiredoxin
LADPDGKIVSLYDTKMDGKDMSNRISFLIGLDGKVVHVTKSGNPQTHFDEMSAAIASLPGQK